MGDGELQLNTIFAFIDTAVFLQLGRWRSWRDPRQQDLPCTQRPTLLAPTLALWRSLLLTPFALQLKHIDDGQYTVTSKATGKSALLKVRKNYLGLRSAFTHCFSLFGRMESSPSTFSRTQRGIRSVRLPHLMRVHTVCCASFPTAQSEAHCGCLSPCRTAPCVGREIACE